MTELDPVIVAWINEAPVSLLLAYVAFQLSRLCEHAQKWQPTLNIRVLEKENEPDKD